MNSKAHRTAIARKSPSQPMKWLDARGLLRGRKLDYGCGRGFDASYYDMQMFDPHYMPWNEITQDEKFNTITCNYVFNVINEDARRAVLADIKSRLVEGGVAYITVRRDLKEAYVKTSRGTEQWFVELDLPLLYENSSMAIYEVRNV